MLRTYRPKEPKDSWAVRQIKINSLVSRGRDRAAPLPTHLLRICAGALKCPEQWGISKFASGKEPIGLFARKHLLTLHGICFAQQKKFVNSISALRPQSCGRKAEVRNGLKW